MCASTSWCLLTAAALVLIGVPAESVEVGDLYRVTSSEERGKTLYYLNNVFSRDGRTIVYFRDLKGGERVGFRSTSIPDAFARLEVSFNGYPWRASGPEEGAWTPDARRYFLNFGTYYIDMQQGRLERLVDDDEFFWPAVSPDYTRLCGINKRSDQDRQPPKVRCYGLEGPASATEFHPPYLDGEFDVSYGWLGNRHLWFRTGKKRILMPVVRVPDGQVEGYLNVFKEDGKPFKFYHVSPSLEAFLLGAEGNGFIVGHTPGVYRASADFRLPGAAERGFISIGRNPATDARLVPVGTHSAISPDESTLLVENVLGNMGVIAAYHLDDGVNASPRWLVRFRPSSSYSERDESTWRPYPHPHWSPDGTKIAFTSDALAGDGIPYLYLYIFKRPGAPTLYQVEKEGDGAVLVRFTPHAFSYETSHWELLYRSRKGEAAVAVAKIAAPRCYVQGAGDAGELLLSCAAHAPRLPTGPWEFEGGSPRRIKEAFHCNHAEEGYSCSRRGGTALPDGASPPRGKGRRAWPDYHASPLRLPVAVARSGWYSMRAVEHSGLTSPPSNGIFLP